MLKFMMNKRILTGMQVTNNIHLGNFCSLKLFQDYSICHESNEKFLFIADLHTITSSVPSYENILTLLKYYIIMTNEKNSYFFIQSMFFQIPYLSWILTCYTSLGQLERMTQYKDKKTNNEKAGILYYPILMAADILIMQANIIPVGSDQKQHVELTRDIAEIMNSTFKSEIFIKPEPYITHTKIMDLSFPNKKMSKSNAEKGTLFLSDNNEEIEKKIMKATTDEFLMPINQSSLHNRPGVQNLCNIYNLITNRNNEYIFNNFGNEYISKFKKELVVELQIFFTHLNKRCHEISNDYVEKLILQNKLYVNEIMNETLLSITKLLGLHYSNNL